MTLLRVDASIRGAASASSPLADLVLAEFSAIRPDEPVVTRHLGDQPLPASSLRMLINAAFTPEADSSPEQAQASALASAIVAELSGADAAVLAFPLYNWGVSQHVKAWIDLAINGSPPGTRLLEGKPVVLVTARGSAYGPGAPREGQDFNTPYLRHVLVNIWGADLTVVERDLNFVGVIPAFERFSEEAGKMKQAAEEAAARAGRILASR